MSEEIKFDHFKDINELLEHIDLWYREDDIEYTRWFGLEDLHILKIYITSLQQKVEQQEKEIDRLNNIIDELENTIANFMENHTEGYIDWKYDREIYLAERNVLQKLYDTYFGKLQELKENK